MEQASTAHAPVGQEHDQGAGGFWPPLHSQRHRAVASFLSSCAVTRVLDFGCGEGSLLSYLHTEPHVRRMAGMDVDEAALDRAVVRTEPTLYEHVIKRASPLTVSLYRGSICCPAHVRQLLLMLLQQARDDSVDALEGEEEKRRDAVVLVEVIEHLEPRDLPAMEANVFGRCRPHHVVVTTPNYEFNVVFNNDPLGGHGHNKRSKALHAGVTHHQSAPETAVAGDAQRDGSARPAASEPTASPSSASFVHQRLPFRHYDHKFEWTRAEFREWCDSVASRYGYRYTLGGVGTREGWMGRATNTELAVATQVEPPSERSNAPDETRTPSPKRSRSPSAALDLDDDVGFCTQIAYFTRDVNQDKAEPTVEATTDSDLALPPLQLYAMHSFPVDTRSQTEKVAAEVAYAYRHVVYHSEGEVEHGDWVSIADRLMPLQAVRELCGASPDRLRADLKVITAGATYFGIEYDELTDCVRLISEDEGEEDEDEDERNDNDGDSLNRDIKPADGDDADSVRRNQTSVWTVSPAATSPGEEGTWGWGNAEDDSA